RGPRCSGTRACKGGPASLAPAVTPDLNAGTGSSTAVWMSLEGRTALVTGGGRGIGRAVAVRLAAQGARVIVAGRTPGELEATAAVVGGTVALMDVADREAAASVVAALGPVDVLVNNAGVAESAPYERTDDALWDRMLAV